MNILFWILIALLGATVYFILSFAFSKIGNIALKIKENLKNNINK